MMSRHLEEAFPRLRGSSYEVTSPRDTEYNCIAWAVGESDRWWWPDGRAFWPDDLPRERSLDAFVQAFGRLGFSGCESPEFEPGFEKIALFADAHGCPTHAAKLQPSGRWTSKLGKEEDIEHELEDLEGSHYGSVATILKRPATPTVSAPSD